MVGFIFCIYIVILAIVYYLYIYMYNVYNKVCSAHGNNVAVRAKFTSNLPPSAY